MKRIQINRLSVITTIIKTKSKNITTECQKHAWSSLIRIPCVGKICKVLLQLVELQSCSEAAICDIRLESFEMQAICKEMLRSRFVDFATDGAAAVMGPQRGAATLLRLREKINEKPFIIHCMNRKLEPAVHVAAKILQR